MLLAGNPRERGDPLGKVTKVVILGKSPTPCINLGGAEGGLDPVYDMFDNSLVELV